MKKRKTERQRENTFIYSFGPFELIYKFPYIYSMRLAHPLLSRAFSFKFIEFEGREERGVNETQPLPHTPFPFLIITSTSKI
jgi:hypothetical protein